MVYFKSFSPPASRALYILALFRKKKRTPFGVCFFCLCDRLILRIAFVIIKKNAKRWKKYDTNYTL